MSTQVEINGKTFLSIKDAAKLVSYSRDYVARLAREEKIVASQVGRQWFVDTVSLKSFAEVADLEKSVHKLRLSAERKREQTVKSEVLSIKGEMQSRAVHDRFKAQMITMLVLGFGLFSGMAIYTTSAILSASEENTARLASASIPQTPTTVLPAVSKVDELQLADPQETALYNNVVEQPIFIDESETRAMSIGDSEGVFLMAREGEVKTEAEVAKLFSDEVEVEFKDDNTGVVRYTADETGEVTEYPFVSVPVKAKPVKLTQAPI